MAKKPKDLDPDEVEARSGEPERIDGIAVWALPKDKDGNPIPPDVAIAKGLIDEPEKAFPSRFNTHARKDENNPFR